MNNSTNQPGSSTSGTFVTSSKYTNNTNLSTHQREVETELMPAPMGPIITGQIASEFFKKSDQQNQQQTQSQNNLQGQGPGPGDQRQNSQQSQGQKTLHFVTQQGSQQAGTMVSQSGSMVSQSVSIVSQSAGPMSSLVSQSGSMSSLISQAGSMGSSQSGSTVNLQQHEEKASFSDIDDLFPSMNNYQPGVVSATLECDATANRYQTQLFDQAGQQIDQNRGQFDQNAAELDQLLLSINAPTTSASTSSQQQNQQAKK